MTQERIPLIAGAQAWRLIRTARDGATAEGVEKTAGPAVARMLREANDSEQPWQIIRTAEREYRIGAARPVRIDSISHEPEPLPDGSTLANRQQGVGDVIPTVRGDNPWFVNVSLWWRASSTTIAYPAIRVDWLGRRTHQLNGADWILDRAVALPDATDDPGDEEWAEGYGDRVSTAAKWLLPTIWGGSFGLLVIGGAVVWAIKRHEDRRSRLEGSADV